jgi:hypothetical protein
MTPYHLVPWQWAVVVTGAFLVGLSKTGIPGIGILAVALFAIVIPAKESSGVVLPVLIAADVIAVAAYRRHAQWNHLWGLFPWAALGILLGYLTVGHIRSEQVNVLIGLLLLGMVVLHLYRKLRGDDADRVPTSLLFTASMGILGGFTTMVANAAGPVMILYLLAMRLPKNEFMGTSAWYFFLLNCFKVPFSANLGLINAASLQLDLPLMAVSMAGAAFGKQLLPYINQRAFEAIALAFTLIAAFRLL